MHLLSETYFSCLALVISFKTLSKFKPLLISDSMDANVKIFRRSRCTDDLKWILISFSLENSFFRMPRSLEKSIVNLDGNKKIIRSLRGKMHYANKRPTKQHTFAITK